MSKKKSIFGRIGQLAKANVNAALDAAEDPGLMLDQTIRDYDNNIAEAEQSVAQTIGNLRMLEEDLKSDHADAKSWASKAKAASDRADSFRAEGDSANAEKFDNLARIALEKMIAEEREAKEKEALVAAQTAVVEKLKSGLNQMKGKRNELVSKRDELVARNKNAKAQNQMMDAIKSIDLTDSTSEISRFEEKIRREEARVVGAAELASSSLDNQFAELENLGEQSDIEARLAALKNS